MRLTARRRTLALPGKAASGAADGRGSSFNSQQAREGAAVEDEVLPGEEAGRGAAQERAGGAELLRRAEAAGGDLGAGALGLLLGSDAVFPGGECDVGAQPVGVEAARQ